MSLVSGQNRCGDAFFYFLFFIFLGDLFLFSQPVKYMIHVDVVIGTRSNFPYTKYGGKSRFIHSQRGIVPIDPAILAATGHNFTAKT